MSKLDEQESEVIKLKSSDGPQKNVPKVDSRLLFAKGGIFKF